MRRRERTGRLECVFCVSEGSPRQPSPPAQTPGKDRSTYRHKGVQRLLHLQVRKENGWLWRVQAGKEPETQTSVVRLGLFVFLNIGDVIE